MHGVLLREKTDLGRHHGRQMRSTAAIESDSDAAAAVADPVTPSVVLASAEDRERLETWLEELPESPRAALRLRLDGIDYAGIARRLEVSEDNARQRVSRALRVLRERWSASW